MPGAWRPWEIPGRWGWPWTGPTAPFSGGCGSSAVWSAASWCFLPCAACCGPIGGSLCKNNLTQLIEPASVSQEPELDPDYGIADGTYRLLGEVGCPAPVSAGDYTLTVTTALYREETGTGQRSLTLGLTAQPRHFWMKEPALSSILMAVDSSGTVYSQARAPWISIWPLESDGGAYRFCVDFVFIPGEPEWIQLQSRLDDSWSLRLELPEEVRP